MRGARHVNEVQRVAVEESPSKIPILFGFDVIHGYRTVFPVPLGQASSWDPAGVEHASRIAAAEASAAGVRWAFAPMVDIARDPRWGRIAEGSGEDPYLGAAMARARVHGFQGDDYGAPDRVVACAKHWVAYGAAEGGREYNTADVSERTLRAVYFPPFRAGSMRLAAHKLAIKTRFLRPGRRGVTGYEIAKSSRSRRNRIAQTSRLREIDEKMFRLHFQMSMGQMGRVEERPGHAQDASLVSTPFCARGNSREQRNKMDILKQTRA